MQNKFKKEDAQRLSQLLNKIVAKGKFEFPLNEFVEFYNELEWVKIELLPKIQANIFEIESVKQVVEKEEKKKEPKKKARK